MKSNYLSVPECTDQSFSQELPNGNQETDGHKKKGSGQCAGTSNGSSVRISKAESYDLDRILNEQADQKRRWLEAEVRRFASERYYFLIAAIVSIIAVVALTARVTPAAPLPERPLFSLVFIDSQKTLPIGILVACIYAAQQFFKSFRVNGVRMESLRGQRLEIDRIYARILSTVHLRDQAEIMKALSELTAYKSNPILAEKQTTSELVQLNLAHENGHSWKALTELFPGCRKNGRHQN